MSERYVVRPYTADDAAAVASILNESISARDSTMLLAPMSAESIREQMEKLGAREVLLVLEEDEAIVGWGIVKQYSDREGYRRTCETSIFLRRSHTGRGLGTVLQRELVTRCRAFGYHHVVVRIVADNDVSIQLHRKFGFEMVGVQREVGFVDGRWRDVAIMQLVFPAE